VGERLIAPAKASGGCSVRVECGLGDDAGESMGVYGKEWHL